MQSQLDSYVRDTIQITQLGCQANPSYPYVVFGPEEQTPIFSGDGDLDGDGLSNAEEYRQVQQWLGPNADTATCISAITDPNNYWWRNVNGVPISARDSLILALGVVILGCVMLRRRAQEDAMDVYHKSEN